MFKEAESKLGSTERPTPQGPWPPGRVQQTGRKSPRGQALSSVPGAAQGRLQTSEGHFAWAPQKNSRNTKDSPNQATPPTTAALASTSLKDFFSPTKLK